MSLSRKLTKEEYDELFNYAHSVLKENSKCTAITRWLNNHHYELDNFLLAYTAVKHGNLDDKSYQDVINEFKEKQMAELKESYNQGFHGQRFMSYTASPLYQAVIQEIEQNRPVDPLKPGFNG